MSFFYLYTYFVANGLIIQKNRLSLKKDILSFWRTIKSVFLRLLKSLTSIFFLPYIVLDLSFLFFLCFSFSGNIECKKIAIQSWLPEAVVDGGYSSFVIQSDTMDYGADSSSPFGQWSSVRSSLAYYDYQNAFSIFCGSPKDGSSFTTSVNGINCGSISVLDFIDYNNESVDSDSFNAANLLRFDNSLAGCVFSSYSSDGIDSGSFISSSLANEILVRNTSYSSFSDLLGKSLDIIFGTEKVTLSINNIYLESAGAGPSFSSLFGNSVITPCDKLRKLCSYKSYIGIQKDSLTVGNCIGYLSSFDSTKSFSSFFVRDNERINFDKNQDLQLVVGQENTKNNGKLLAGTNLYLFGVSSALFFSICIFLSVDALRKKTIGVSGVCAFSFLSFILFSLISIFLSFALRGSLSFYYSVNFFFSCGGLLTPFIFVLVYIVSVYLRPDYKKGDISL